MVAVWATCAITFSNNLQQEMDTSHKSSHKSSHVDGKTDLEPCRTWGITN
jgi:hypothetical protein